MSDQDPTSTSSEEATPAVPPTDAEQVVELRDRTLYLQKKLRGLQLENRGLRERLKDLEREPQPLITRPRPNGSVAQVRTRLLQAGVANEAVCRVCQEPAVWMRNVTSGAFQMLTESLEPHGHGLWEIDEARRRQPVTAAEIPPPPTETSTTDAPEPSRGEIADPGSQISVVTTIRDNSHH